MCPTVLGTPDGGYIVVGNFHLKTVLVGQNCWPIAVMQRNPKPPNPEIQHPGWNYLAERLLANTVRVIVGINKNYDADPLVVALKEHVDVHCVVTSKQDPASICVLGGVQTVVGGHSHHSWTAVAGTWEYPHIYQLRIKTPHTDVANTKKSIMWIEGTGCNRSEKLVNSDF